MDIFTSAGGVLVNDEGKIFLTRKIERDEWGLPKGGQEVGEELIDTAKREIQEETGFRNIELIADKQIGHNYFEFVNPKTGKRSGKNVYFYLFRIINDERIDTPEMVKEGFEGRWMDFDEALDLISFDAIKVVVKNAQRLLRV